MERLWQDVRYGARALVAHPTYTLTAVLTLGLGVGAIGAMFSVCEAVLFRRLPYPEPDRLVMLWERTTRDGRLGGVAPANFVDWRAQGTSFDNLAALNPFPEFTIVGHGEPERVAGAAVSSALFSLLGTRMALGRTFLADEDQPGRSSVVVLSHALWQRRFGSDKSIVGRPLTLNGGPFIVVGVLPPDFQLANSASGLQGRDQFDIWMPLALNPQRLQRGTHPFRVFGRLRAGTTIDQAQAEVDVIAKILERDYPATNRERAIHIVPLAEHVTRDVRAPLLTLLVAVVFVWLIACVNIANLLLTRAAVRQKEMAVRLALGAGRLRLAQQLVTESVLLASLGAVVGAGLAWWSLKALTQRVPFDLPRAAEIGLNAEVLGFISVISLVTAVVCNCVPLMRSIEGGQSLATGRHTVTRGQARTRNVLIVGQISLACILLVGAGLMGRSLCTLLNVSPGFDAGQVLTAQISLTSRQNPDVRRIAAFQRAFLARLHTLPGVRSAGIGGYLPLGGVDNSWAPRIEGGAPLAPSEFLHYRPVTPAYIDTLAIPLRQGRGFSESDNEDAPAVAIVNEAAAARYWPNQNPIGRRLQIDGPPWRTVVGIVGNVRHAGLDIGAQPELYLPFAQVPYPNAAMTVVVRTAGEPSTLATTLRATLAESDPTLALARVRTMDEVVESSVGARRFRAILLGAFASAALLLACIGVYGVMSYLVSQRTREFGVRAALGATRRDLLGLVLARAAVLIATGLGFGLLGAIGLARLVRSLLYGVTPYDLATLVSVAVLLTTAALLASYVPARRAARVDPMEALRAE